MKITLGELNSHGYPTTPEIDATLQILLERLNKVRDAYGVPMIITSGLRSLELQMKVNPKAPHSKHLSGQAADVLDQNGVLKKWILAHLPLMEESGLWFEAFDSTGGEQGGWVHAQIVPPASQHRFFLP